MYSIKVCSFPENQIVKVGQLQYRHRMAAVTLIARHASVVTTVWTSVGESDGTMYSVRVLARCLNEAV